MKAFKQIVQFFRKDIWKDPRKQSSTKRFIYRWLRILISSVQGFIKNKGFDKASTITFYTLLAIIPLIAISFGIAQELGFADKFTEEVKVQFRSQPEVAEKLIQFSDSTLKTTQGGVIASFGLVVLFWTVIKTLGNIEVFFNDIWQVETPRTLWQSIKRYTPLILLFPVFLVGSSSVIVYMSTTALAASESIQFLNFLNPVILYLFNFISYLVSWCLLSLLYIYVPNTKVPWKAGFKAGIITGILYFIWQWVYVTFQVKASNYGAIYGSFAAVPLFLIWLNYSWLILIFGARLCYQIQQETEKKTIKPIVKE
jgi:membrane protein